MGGAGKFGKIFQAMIDRYTKCQVEWQEPNAPIIDPAPPRSIAEQVDDSYANNNDDSYNTNEKIVEVMIPTIPTRRLLRQMTLTIPMRRLLRLKTPTKPTRRSLRWTLPTIPTRKLSRWTIH